MSTALTHAEDTQITASNGRIALESNPRRIRAFFAGHAVADTTRSVYLFERGRLPMYYIPLADVRTEFLVPTSTTTHCPWKGDATYWTIEIGDRRAEDAVWTYPEQFDGSLDLSEYVAFYWDRMDAWYEEDQQVFVHARDPYVRIDALPSSRHVRVFVGDVLVAETRRPRLLFETGLPTRYYIPRIDVHSEYFAPSPTTTACPYKGTASYLSFTGTTELAPIEDLAWFYPFTTAEASGIDDHVSFYPERVGKILVDGAEI
ncbi:MULTISPECIES: DUF427 domain-containing protein [Rhodococcus]|uniref:DUF427 domain-containing protein n=1 Tax=Rhodococcus TaxID=1827 RepID=UPI0007AE6B67|nr:MULTISPECIES: DUF427 domain-containing protein [Rhodococcus]MYV26167.1 DUF427 domain-containing protein [Rhodococcus erythropolis]KZL33951.1 hypothetical protein A3852_17210 [Rhodococcus qingshengii]MBQ9053258.1 DUF427 domain-containing protein [Rhodococcus sp. (in: high G+C Gram-positive bacteria)]MCE4160800.1 DUF427 domain-containing protein [Rhodococcus sp. Ni2]BCF84755.1 hypothetical protein RQCS_43000 [Rhodococcus qingshengii]